MSQLQLKIDGQKFDFFNNFAVSLKYNGIASTFSFSGFYDPDNTFQRNLFTPLKYHDIDVLFENVLLLRGTALSITTGIADKKPLANISGYSKPGVLQDCDIPLSLYPLQFDNLTLKEITEKLIKPFGLKLIVDPLVASEVNKKFEQISAESTQKIASFLSELAKQRNVVLTHTPAGELFYTRLNIKKPSIATYIENVPTTAFNLNVNGQGLHSEISAQKQATIDSNVAGEATIINSLVNKFRPLSIDQDSGDNNDTQLAAKMARGRELRSIGLAVNTDRWKWYNEKDGLTIIKPNEIIEVQSNNIFLKSRTRFFVEEVTLQGDEKSTTAAIKCVLPETYSGDAPKIVFS